MLVAELKAELTERGLDAVGKKAELVQRLEEALASGNAAPAKAEVRASTQKRGHCKDFDHIFVLIP